MRKLNTLIAVLEVAAARCGVPWTPPARTWRKLGRIRANLQDTLDVCVRARSALEQRGKISGALADDLSEGRSDLAQSARALHEAGAMSGPRKAARKRPAIGPPRPRPRG
ncbi:MAG: hypothetical protein IPK67_19110 [Planctomycetes bacterium]|nr:hypothetical protein [Planctomycetota bacterium]